MTHMPYLPCLSCYLWPSGAALQIPRSYPHSPKTTPHTFYVNAPENPLLLPCFYLSHPKVFQVILLHICIAPNYCARISALSSTVTPTVHPCHISAIQNTPHFFEEPVSPSLGNGSFVYIINTTPEITMFPTSHCFLKSPRYLRYLTHGHTCTCGTLLHLLLAIGQVRVP